MLFDSLKASSSINATEILFSIILGSCFLMEGGWLECLLMYVVLVLGFVYTWYLPDIRSSETSRKLVELAPISIVMLKPAFLNIFIISFFILSRWVPLDCFIIPKSSSLYRPIYFRLVELLFYLA